MKTRLLHWSSQVEESSGKKRCRNVVQIVQMVLMDRAQMDLVGEVRGGCQVRGNTTVDLYGILRRFCFQT